MSTAAVAPIDETITIEQLTRDPYPIYRRLRRQAPVLRVKSVGRTFLTKAADTRMVKDNAALFSSDDPNTPMKRAFLARTLMRKDHDEHRAERMAMMPALMPKTIEEVWAPLYAKLAADYLGRLPRGEVVDLFGALAGPLAATVPASAVVLVNQPASSVCVGKHSRSEYGISNSLEVHGRIALPCMTPAGGAFSTNRARLLPRSGGSGESARSTRGNTTSCTKPLQRQMDSISSYHHSPSLLAHAEIKVANG